MLPRWGTFGYGTPRSAPFAAPLSGPLTPTYRQNVLQTDRTTRLTGPCRKPVRGVRTYGLPRTASRVSYGGR